MFADDVVLEEVSSERVLSFGILNYKNEMWDLSHLDPFAFHFELEPEYPVTVVVFFSCHCFTRSLDSEPRPSSDIPAEEIYDNGRERRVLCPDRYAMSQRLLREIVSNLAAQRITLADEWQSNYVTFKTTDLHGMVSVYAVFFKVSRAKVRKRRLILQVQSAYVLDRGLTKRQRAAKRVTLRSILLAAMEGRSIRA
jgi:hypothetical protein